MWKLELTGIIVHFFLLISVFDIYLQQEVYRGQTQNCTNIPLAKRLILITFDGIEEDEAMNVIYNDMFLRQRMESGIWGTAEKANLIKSSGITAIATGFEEIPRPFSSIYGNAKYNFDNIFNYVSNMIYVGNLKNLDNFNKVKWENYANKLDSGNKTNIYGIIDAVKMVIRNRNDNLIKKSNLIIFVGMSNESLLKELGESNKNYIKKYKSDLFRIKLRKIIQVIEETFTDGETSFILCSDNIDHTINEKHNELFILWGKGINKIGSTNISMKDLCLMASTILGNPIPISSTGTWHKSFLTLSLREETFAIACNAFHLSSMANRTLQQVGNKLMEALYLSSESDSQILEKYQAKIKNLLSSYKNESSEINEISEELASFSLKILEKDVIFMKSMIFYLTHSLSIAWAITLLIEILLFKITKHPDQEMRIQILRKKTELWFFGIHTLLILLGTISILFIIIKDWPLHYMFYWLIALTIWGFVLGNFQIWTGIMDHLNFLKLGIISGYIIIYAIACECFLWGLIHKLVLCGTIIAITLYNWLKCFINNKSLLVKICSVLSGLTVAGTVHLSTLISSPFESPIVVILTGITLPVVGIFCAYYMRYNTHDFLMMTVSIFFSCISLIMTSFKLYHTAYMVEIICWILFLVGIILPIFGEDDKINRLQYVAVSIGSSIMFLSKGFEPLIVMVIFAFSFYWVLIDKPQHKTKYLNRHNSFHSVVFTALTFTTLQLIWGLDPIQAESHFSIEADIFEKLKLLLVLLIPLIAFTVLKHENGGDSQLVMSLILLHYCSYRLFLGMEFHQNDVFPKQLGAYCAIQITMIFIFLVHSFSKFIVHAKITNLKKWLWESLRRIFNIRIL